MITHSLDTILNHLRDSRPARYGAMVTIGLSAGDVPVMQSGRAAINALDIVCTGREGLRALKRASVTLIKSIDPRLEALSPEAILSAGKASIGNAKSPFISNPQIITPEEIRTFDLLVRYGFFSDKELNSFANLMGSLHQQQALAALAYQASPNAKSRMQIAQLNAETGTVPAIMINHLLARKPGVTHDAESGCMDMNSLKKHYPHTSNAIPLIQKIDDQRDIILDIMDEIHNGRPSTNYLLAKAHEQDAIVNESGRLLPSLVVSSARAFRNNATISIDKLHPVLQKALEATDKEFRAEASDFNPFTRKLLLTAWENGLKHGIKPAKNERLESARLALGRA